MQLLLMNNGVHFSTFPVSNIGDIQLICEAQLSGEVGRSISSFTLLQTGSCSLFQQLLQELFAVFVYTENVEFFVQAQTVILINCGGEVDLLEELRLDQLETRIIVADSHRWACRLPCQDRLRKGHCWLTHACTQV